LSNHPFLGFPRNFSFQGLWFIGLCYLPWYAQIAAFTVGVVTILETTAALIVQAIFSLEM
jgi:hypothetical protein